LQAAQREASAFTPPTQGSENAHSVMLKRDRVAMLHKDKSTESSDHEGQIAVCVTRF
jgi:hypothetical protein